MEEATSNTKNESDTKSSQESFKNFLSCSYRIFSRILHPTLASFYCVAREVLSLDETSSRLAITPTNEIISVYATHVLVFAADRLDDPTYPTAVLRGMVLLCLLALSQTITSLFSNTGSCLMVFAGALVLYPQVKKVPYLKCFWVPLAFAGASSAAAGAFSPMTTSSPEFFVCAFLYFLGNCSACDIEDIQEDKGKGIQTIATKLGSERTRYMSALSIGLSVVILLACLLQIEHTSVILGEGCGVLPLPSLHQTPAIYGCVVSSSLFSLGLLLGSNRIKDMDILNWLPLLARIATKG